MASFGIFDEIIEIHGNQSFDISFLEQRPVTGIEEVKECIVSVSLILMETGVKLAYSFYVSTGEYSFMPRTCLLFNMNEFCDVWCPINLPMLEIFTLKHIEEESFINRKSTKEKNT